MASHKKDTVDNQGGSDADPSKMKKNKVEENEDKKKVETRPEGEKNKDFGGQKSNETKNDEDPNRGDESDTESQPENAVGGQKPTKTNDERGSNLSGGQSQNQSDKTPQPKNNTCDLKPKEANVASTKVKKDDKIESQTVHKSCNITAIFSNINNKYKLVLAFVVPVVIASLALYFRKDTNIISKNKEAHMEKYNTAMNKMKNDFPGQTERFWKILRNRGNAYLKNPSPKRPLVIMVAASPSAHNVLDCMARKIANSLEREDDVTNIINGADFKTYSDLDHAKRSLDEILDHHLQKSRTLIVLNLDLIPPQSPLLFYEYCDNENAPYKEAVIVFTIRLKVEPSPSLTPAKAEGLVEKHLKEIWRDNGYRPDDINPLVSRVTDTIVLVNQESEEVINTHVHCAA